MPEIVDIDFPRVSYGPSVHQWYSLNLHPVRDPGGNPLLIYKHGGGAVEKDARLCWIPNGNGNSISWYLQGNGASHPGGGGVTAPVLDLHLDVASVNCRQAKYNIPVTVHSQNGANGWFNEPWTGSTYFPDAWNDLKLAIAHLKDFARERGQDPYKFLGMGSSYGGMQTAWACLTPPLRGMGGAPSDFHRPGSTYRKSDSTLLGAILHITPIDVRNDTALAPGADFIDESALRGFFGTANSTEWNQVQASQKAAISIFAHIESGSAWYPPGGFHTIYQDLGGGAATYPLSNPHHHSQRDQLNSALAAKGWTYSTQPLYGSGEWTDTSPATQEAISELLYEKFIERILG